MTSNQIAYWGVREQTQHHKVQDMLEAEKLGFEKEKNQTQVAFKFLDYLIPDANHAIEAIAKMVG